MRTTNEMNADMTNSIDKFPQGEVLTIHDSDERMDAITRKILAIVCCSVELNDRCNLLLSGNEALEGVYAMLMLDPDLRGLPWHAVHAWKLQEVDDQGIYEMITFHSGMPDEHVHQVPLEANPEQSDDVQFDCCIVDLSDIPTIPAAVSARCTSIVVVATDREKLLTADSIETNAIVYWFTSTIDLQEENH